MQIFVIHLYNMLRHIKGRESPTCSGLVCGDANDVEHLICFYCLANVERLADVHLVKRYTLSTYWPSKAGDLNTAREF